MSEVDGERARGENVRERCFIVTSDVRVRCVRVRCLTLRRVRFRWYSSARGRAVLEMY